ncbi:MAG: hypothetical protein R3C61_21095 [Bacteroidia bacterium]
MLIDIVENSFSKGPQRIGQQMYRTVISLYLNYTYFCDDEAEKIPISKKPKLFWRILNLFSMRGSGECL